jgi:hypothetical protein
MFSTSAAFSCCSTSTSSSIGDEGAEEESLDGAGAGSLDSFHPASRATRAEGDNELGSPLGDAMIFFIINKKKSKS